MKRLDPSKVDTIVIHTSDSYYGNVEIIDSWHKDNGWLGIGYHFLITNCYPTYTEFVDRNPKLVSDGMVYEGRPEEFIGAHVKGHNNHTLGVCLVGKEGMYTSRQIASAADLVADLMYRFPAITEIKGHNQFPGVAKGCPVLSMEGFNEYVRLMREEPERFDPYLAVI